MARQKLRSLTRSVFIVTLVLTCVVCALTLLIGGKMFQQSQIDDAFRKLAGEVDALEDVNAGRLNKNVLQTIQLADTRVTLIDNEGSVIYDSTVDASSLPNHKDRPEVAEALTKGTGQSERASSTLGYVSIYYAKKLPTGDVLRLATDRSDLSRIYLQNSLWALALLAVLIVIAYISARVLSKRLVAPILHLNVDDSELVSPYSELDPLVGRIVEQKEELQGRVRDLEELNEMRRHFSANITHELKTPIASIMGASELIQHGICKPDDIPDFAKRIHSEATRLSLLVNDILTLSKLDESERADDRILFGDPEWVDLFDIAQDVVEHMSDKARSRKVKLHIKGVHCFILGYPKLLDEMVKNLVDNAIRYNREGGEVFVMLLPNKDKIELSVADTGIGIDECYQEKVFERFWRVDTSRSRASGGTGLGLAIVKHAVNFHAGTLNLTSKLGEGTTIRVTFLKAALDQQN